MQDMHANEEEFAGILSTLKPDGILIFSADDCEDDYTIQLQDLFGHPSLKLLDLPFFTKEYAGDWPVDYTAFQKVIPAKPTTKPWTIFPSLRPR